jgi:hypothetical protein
MIALAGANLHHMERSTQNFFFGVALIAIGLVLSNSGMGADSSLGGVLIALGGFFLILGIFRKRKEWKEK